MSRRYRINLYFPSEQSEAALAAVFGMVAARQGEETEVRFPSGRSLRGPFATRTGSGPLLVKRRGGGELLTSLLFPVDDEIRSFGVYATESVEGEEHAAIGTIYLSVHVGCRFAELSFMAATSAMSDLFVRSRSVQGRFLQLSRQAGGVAELIFDENREGHLLLADPTRRVRFDYLRFVDEVDRSPVDADGLAEAVFEAIGRPAPKLAIDAAWAAWDGGTAWSVARAIRAEGRFGDLPILADALEEAGVRDAELLGHFRHPGEHEGDCYLLDYLLGRT